MGWWWNGMWVMQNHPVTEGKTYQFSGWVRDGSADGASSLIPNGITITYEWRVAPPDGPTGPRYDEIDPDGDGNTGEHRNNVSFDLTGEWTYVSTEQVAPETAQGVTIGFYASVGITYDIDDASFIEVGGKANSPDPTDGSYIEQTWKTLAWKPGNSAVSHDVYVGDNFDDVDDDLGFDRGGEDPKDLIEYHVRTMLVGFLIYQKRYDLAESQCRQLISERPSFYRPYFNLAKIAIKQDNYAQAVTNFEKVIELEPHHVYSYEGLGAAYEAQGQFDKAVLGYAKALELRPDYVKAYYKMALCFYELGEFREPDKYITAVLMNNPSYVDAAISLAEKLLERRQIRLAYEHYLRILELRDDSVTVLNALAWIQAACDIEGLRNPEQALERALRACEMTNYGVPEVVDTLAVAYAAAGRFPEARETAEKAIQLTSNTALAQRIANRLKLYEAGKPYLDPSLTHDTGE